HFVVGGQLLVKPNVLEGQTRLFKEVENQLQLGVDERLPSDPPIKDCDPDHGFPIQNRHRYLRTEQFKFLLRLGVVECFIAVAAEDASEAKELAADAGFERQFKVLEQAGGN